METYKILFDEEQLKNYYFLLWYDLSGFDRPNEMIEVEKHFGIVQTEEDKQKEMKHIAEIKKRIRELEIINPNLIEIKKQKDEDFKKAWEKA